MSFRSLLPIVLVVFCFSLSCATAAEPPKQHKLKHEPGTTKGIVDIENFERPETATVLVSKEGFDLVPNTKEPSNWKFEDGVLTASHVWDGLLTKKPYTDFVMHLEFNVNDNGSDNHEKNGNSGVYIQERYELQISNAYGVPEEEFKAGYGGSLYRMKKPDKLVSKPAGQWQDYIIVFRAARFDGDKKVENARITVYHNGVVIHDDFEMRRKTGAGKREGPDPRPILLQGHANPVKFRNVWIQELELK
ncbi:MAG: DUF1080 domain-containing protein [Planctomycetota bacterium]